MEAAKMVELNQPSKISFVRLLYAGLLAAGASTGLNLVIANILRFLFDVPKEYTPLTFLPIVSGCLGGSLGAMGVFGVIARCERKPFVVFYVVVGVVLVASYSLPLRLLNSTSPRFAGHNLPTLLGQMVMHTIVAACCLFTLHWWGLETNSTAQWP